MPHLLFFPVLKLRGSLLRGEQSSRDPEQLVPGHTKSGKINLFALRHRIVGNFVILTLLALYFKRKYLHHPLLVA